MVVIMNIRPLPDLLLIRQVPKFFFDEPGEIYGARFVRSTHECNEISFQDPRFSTLVTPLKHFPAIHCGGKDFLT